MEKNKDIKKEDFLKDVKSKKGFLNPLKKIIETKKSPIKKDSSR
jgi:hypothetical protein